MDTAISDPEGDCQSRRSKLYMRLTTPLAMGDATQVSLRYRPVRLVRFIGGNMLPERTVRSL